MAIVEEVEEEVKKVPDAVESEPGTAQSGSGGGHDGGSQEEGEEFDEDGFETASEGREGGSDGDEYDAFLDGDEKFGRLDIKDDDEGIVDAAERSTSGDGVAEGEEKMLRDADVGEVADQEQQQPLSEEQEREIRQQGIDEATRAKAEGNLFFGQGEYEEAVTSYQKGLTACPLKDPEDSAVKEIRAVLYSNRAACFSHKQMYKEAVEESTKALELNPNYIKALARRYQAKEKLELYEDAIVDVKKVLELDPGNTQAKLSLVALLPLAEEKREKLKAEMMDKLKEAGNSILGRFGMSVDNFKTVKDPNTGSYSIQFQR